jgi:hypothetical protein
MYFLFKLKKTAVYCPSTRNDWSKEDKLFLPFSHSEWRHLTNYCMLLKRWYFCSIIINKILIHCIMKYVFSLTSMQLRKHSSTHMLVFNVVDSRFQVAVLLCPSAVLLPLHSLPLPLPAFALSSSWCHLLEHIFLPFFGHVCDKLIAFVYIIQNRIL